MFEMKVLLFQLSAAEELDMENEFLLPPVFGEEYEEQPRPRSKKKVMKRNSILAFMSCLCVVEGKGT